MALRADAPGLNSWTLDLSDLGAPALARVRRWATGSLHGLADDDLADVLLAVTELVTNAYDHGNGPTQIRMSHTPTPGEVVIEVDDHSLDHPVLAHPHDTQLRGRGMLIVNQLAKVWGVLDHPGAVGKTVWARIPCNG